MQEGKRELAIFDPQTRKLDRDATRERFMAVFPRFPYNDRDTRVLVNRACDFIEWWEPIDDVADYRLLFEFARSLKALFEIRHRAAKYATLFTPLAELVVDGCYQRGFVDDLWDRWDWDDPEDIAIHFRKAWNTVRFAKGENLLCESLKLANEEPLAVRGQEPGGKYVRLLSMAYHLQRRQGKEPIALPIPKVAELTGLPPTTIGALIANALDDRFLKLVDARYTPGKRARAFRFNVRHRDIVKPRRTRDQVHSNLQLRNATERDGEARTPTDTQGAA